MRFEDWHTHNSLCRHAKGSIEDYIKKAVELNLSVIGVSDHFPYGFLSSEISSLDDIPYKRYAMALDEVEGYILELEHLKEKHKNKILVKSAFEIDYFKNQEHVLNRYLKDYINKLDYILGSVHVLFGKAGIFAFDDGRFLNKYKVYDNNDEIYLEFYNTLQDMIKSKEFDFDIVSHFDLPKKFDKRAETYDLIMEKVVETLELAKKRDLAIEINSSGLRKKIREQYPSVEIIEKMYELDIPVLLGSDAHKIDEIAYEFKYIIDLLKNIGYNQLAHYNKRRRTFIEID